MNRAPAMAPLLSFVIPVFNEEAILHAALVDLRERLKPLGWSYEILLAENGSRDGTREVAQELAPRMPELRLLSWPEPNYGAALREGILQARGQLVLCEEIDLCDVDFHQRAIAHLERGALDMVIGSKLLEGSRDERPLGRHLASLAYNRLLRVLAGFSGTDTHGLKAFRRESLLPIVRACQLDRDVFASELVIRAERAGLRIQEIPVRVMEKRTPSIELKRRVPVVLRQLAQLTWSIRRPGAS